MTGRGSCTLMETNASSHETASTCEVMARRTLKRSVRLRAFYAFTKIRREMGLQNDKIVSKTVGAPVNLLARVIVQMKLVRYHLKTWAQFQGLKMAQ